MKPDPKPSRRLVLFTKPAVPGRVKTRLTTRWSPREAARLHQAFLEDVLGRLVGGEFDLWVAWALEVGEDLPRLEGIAVGEQGPGARRLRFVRQEGEGLGDRLHRALAAAARDAEVVMALGSDHPTVSLETIHEAFRRVEAGADAVVGPSDDGGYFLIALARHAVGPEPFEGVAWSTERVLDETLERLERAGWRVELLPTGRDIDTPEDLERLAMELATGEVDPALCPRTVRLLEELGALPEAQNPLAPIRSPSRPTTDTSTR